MANVPVRIYFKNGIELFYGTESLIQISEREITPSADDWMILGDQTARWSDIFAVNGHFDTSLEAGSILTQELNISPTLKAAYNPTYDEHLIVSEGRAIRIGRGIWGQPLEAALTLDFSSSLTSPDELLLNSNYVEINSNLYEMLINAPANLRVNTPSATFTGNINVGGTINAVSCSLSNILSATSGQFAGDISVGTQGSGLVVPDANTGQPYRILVRNGAVVCEPVV
ncbi:MAG: hypothetical protein KIH08_14915 [Candidatus Freyarchaeota archaeon]|nr:hypothetical protein [Candidatus Jordarchaeia archaeon]